MSGSINSGFNPGNPLKEFIGRKTNAIILAHGLIGTVRSKSANGLMMHSSLFNIAGIVDKMAIGLDTAKVCPGVKTSVTIYPDVESALRNQQASVFIILVPLLKEHFSDIEIAIKNGLSLVNNSFHFLKDNVYLRELTKKYGVKFFDLRDVSHQQEYPNINILKRKARVIFVTGTDCGLGKRTATFEMTREARRRGINAVMYATGQTGLMLGERGTVVDGLLIEFSNGVISQHITKLDEEGYELILVEGQSDIFHPANSAVSLAILHGCNPDGIVIVHDEHRKNHKGFEEESPLYSMHSIKNYIKVLEMLSLPCGPKYKVAGIATIGLDNIEKISRLLKDSIPVSDVLLPGGPGILLDAVLLHLEKSYSWFPAIPVYTS